MSVIAAIVKGNTVYMAADNQTSCRDTMEQIEFNTKVSIIGNRLVGASGNVTVIQMGLALLKEYTHRRLTMKLLVNEFLPALFKKVVDSGLAKPNYASIRSEVGTFLIAEGTRLYEVSANGVIKIADADTIGSGGPLILLECMKLQKEAKGKIKEGLVDAIKYCSTGNIYVNSTVVVADTRGLSLEVYNDNSI